MSEKIIGDVIVVRPHTASADSEALVKQEVNGLMKYAVEFKTVDTDGMLMMKRVSDREFRHMLNSNLKYAHILALRKKPAGTAKRATVAFQDVPLIIMPIVKKAVVHEAQAKRATAVNSPPTVAFRSSDVVNVPDVAVVRKASVHTATFSNPTPTKQRMVKQQAVWSKTQQKSKSGQEVYAHRNKMGGWVFGVWDGEKVRRVSKQFIKTGTHPAKKIYKRKAGVSPRTPAMDYIQGGGASTKEFRLARKKFLGAESKSERRKDRMAPNQPLTSDAATYDPFAEDFLGIDDNRYSAHPRLKKGGVYGMNPPRSGAIGERSKAAAAQRRAEGFVPKARKQSIRPGSGKGSFAQYVQANYDAALARIPPVYRGRERSIQVMKEIGRKYREEAGGPPLLPPKRRFAKKVRFEAPDFPSIGGAKRDLISFEDAEELSQVGKRGRF